MARFFIERPIFAIVVSLIIMLAGVISIVQLPVAQFPQITPPSVKVSTSYTGANATAVESAVASAVEDQVNGAQGMMYMNSYSTSNGAYNMTATFNVGTDPNTDANLVQNRVQAAVSSLPTSVNSYGVTVSQQSPAILMIVTLYSPGNLYDSLFLSNYATINLVNNIARVPGVGNTLLVGAGDYAMRVWLRPDAMAGLGLETNDVVKALQAQNSLAPAGQLGLAPANNPAPVQMPVNVRGMLDSAKQFDDVVLKSQSGGDVRLGDIGTSQLAAQNYSLYSDYNGRPSVNILIYQTPSANALATSAAVRKTLDQSSKSFPPGLSYSVPLDTTAFVNASIHDVLKTLLEAFVLVSIVVFLFLGTLRATLIPLLAVPVSLVGAFAFFIPFGFSINTLSLFGIVLAIGIVVDDAIVVVEATELHIEQGLSPKDAALKAMSEVQGPVIAVALVLTAVFVPAAFLAGITGQLYQQFALTISFSVVLSAVVALTLTPALCALILRPRTAMRGPVGRFIGWFDGIFERGRMKYMNLLRLAIRRAAIMLVLLAGFAIGAGGLLKVIPSSFVPLEDQGYFFLAVNLPPGAALSRTEKTSQDIVRNIRGVPGIQDVITLGGFNILNSQIQSNTAAIAVVLKPWDDRKSKVTGLKNVIITCWNIALKELNASVLPIPPPPISGLGNSGGFQFMIEDRTAHTPEQLAAVSNAVLAAAAKRPELTNVFGQYSTGYPQIDLRLNRDAARSLGVNLDAVYQTLQGQLGGLIVNNVVLFNRNWKVMLQADPQYRMTPSDIGMLMVRNDKGQMVPLSAFASPSLTNGPNLIQRYNGYRSAEIDGQPAGDYSSGQAIAAMEDVARTAIPAGYAYEWTGTAYQEQLAGSTQAVTFILSLVLVFLFLAALYESWSIPLAVILGVPVGVFGAFAGALLWHLSIDVYIQIGLIMLIGLAAKNAILIIEFAKSKHEQDGLSVADAALEGAKVRFRPILMTSFAFILGVVPLMLPSGAGAASRHSLGTAVFFGMLFATTFGVFFIPVLYDVIQSAGERRRRRRNPVEIEKLEAPA